MALPSSGCLARDGFLAQLVFGSLVGITAGEMIRASDLHAQLANYAAYHQHPINQVIHFVCVPAILHSALLMADHFSLFGVNIKVFNHEISWATLIAAMYITFYLHLDSRVGIVYSAIIALFYLSARFIRCKYNDQAMRIALIAQIVSWYLQLHPGHAIFEKVKPALLDSLGQAVSVAPLFAFYEGVWALGLEPALRDQIRTATAARRAEMCASEPLLSFCDSSIS